MKIILYLILIFGMFAILVFSVETPGFTHWQDVLGGAAGGFCIASALWMLVWMLAERYPAVCCDGQSQADMTLIAAAPDMLAALKKYARWFSDPATCNDPGLKPLRQQVIAAIAKAEGHTLNSQQTP